ncbi:MAG TPA: chemotaxis protein CheX [Candidatus Acidoferrales bacterium]|jgi:chemotaxis protein CheX|nr:chemotaxis protein CheX [Candidatus Acidoferrales bacterium]
MNPASPSHAADERKNWVPLLDLATREVFQMMLASELKALETETEPSMDITSMVGLAGRLCGMLSVRCTKRLAALMASKMLGTDPDAMGREIEDACGEVCNMVAGNFKNKISGLNDGCMLSVPTVITGKDYSMRSLTDYPALEVRLELDGMPIVVSLEIHS